MTLSDDLRAKIKEHAIEEYPKECCGYVVSVNGLAVVRRCANKAHTPEETFLIAPEESQIVETEGTVLALYHSHPNAPSLLNETDMAMSEALQLPSFVYSYPEDQWSEYYPNGWECPLRGREFCYGIHDCYSLVRDYYKSELGVEINDYPRGEYDWWSKDLNYYYDNFQKEGFVRVEDLKKHDVIMMTIRSKVINHVAVYLGDGNILHHCINRLSCVEPFGGYWMKNASFVVRHKSQL